MSLARLSPLHVTAAAIVLLVGCMMSTPASAQNNTCRFAFDGDCDEPSIGTGLCARGTDTADCSLPAGPNSCQYAHDGECDHPGVGSGACPPGTDSADCSRALGPDGGRASGANSCQWAYDGECDHPGVGTGACAPGTDTADCSRPPPTYNTCQYSNDGECDEPGIGTGLCAAGTDTSDCSGVSSPSNLVYQIQARLRGLGYNPGSVDGMIGPRTRNAIRRFQGAYGLPQTGQATQELLSFLQGIK